MALSQETKRRLTVALTSGEAADEVAAPLAGIAKIGNTTNLRTDSVANLGADAEARLDALEAKVDAIIAALSA